MVSFKDSRSIKQLRIGTRASPLAIVQAKIFQDKLRSILGVESCIVPIITVGDEMNPYLRDFGLRDFGGKALFSSKIHDAIVSGEIDVAVHSLKDLDANYSKEIQISCIYDVEDSRDVIILNNKYKLSKDASIDECFGILDKGAKIGTCSIRRFGQCLLKRQDLIQVQTRGNVETRINLLHQCNLDAIILAYAGIKRLNLDIINLFIFNKNEMLPAVGQGMLVAEILKKNEKKFSFIKKLNNKGAYEQSKLERFFLKKINGSCNSGAGVDFNISKVCTLESIYIYNNKTIEVKKKCSFEKRYDVICQMAKEIISKI